MSSADGWSTKIETVLKSWKAEIPCEEHSEKTRPAYEEAEAVLEFRPDRLGHALLLPPSLQEKLADFKIPVESCPTSNVMTLELARHHSGSLLDGLRQHPQLCSWLQNGHPLSIGTDDPGVFHTSPTKELMLLQKAFGLERTDLVKIVKQSMEQAFCSDKTRKIIQERIQRFLN